MNFLLLTFGIFYAIKNIYNHQSSPLLPIVTPYFHVSGDKTKT